MLAALPLVARAETKHVFIAPADEYFGKMKMSILGIRNEIHDLTLRIGWEPAKAESAFLSQALLTEDALDDWSRKYPTDPWVPRAYFMLERMYSVVHWSNTYNEHAKHIMAYLHTRYAKTWYGKQATRELAKGDVGKLIPTPAPTNSTTTPTP